MDKNKKRKINEAADEFIKSRKNANSLMDIIQEFDEADNRNDLLACIKAFEKIFCHVLDQRTMVLNKKQKTNDSLQQYVTWLNERYVDVQDKLIVLFNNKNDKIKNQSLKTLMSFIECEGKHPLNPEAENCFPFTLFSKIIHKILDTTKENKIINEFLEYSCYDDVNFFMMKALFEIMKQTHAVDQTEQILMNVYILLIQVDLKKMETEDEPSNLCLNLNGDLNYHKNYTYSCKIFSDLWMKFLKCKLSNSIYKKILIHIDSKVLPHLKNPLLLTDFFIESFDRGGPISVLALNGLFFLIQKYNLEYPEFYTKLYSLFDAPIFYTKYCSRFFHLADIFLSSTYLPSYLIAAFVKRLSRLSLNAPVTKLSVVIPFIANLLMRHPTLICLVNRKSGVTTCCEDPYKMEEKDPAKCNAMDSSLWEIKDMQSHWHPDIATQALFIDKPLPKMEFDLSECLDTDFDDLVESVKRKKLKTCPTNYIKPVELIPSDSVLWSL